MRDFRLQHVYQQNNSVWTWCGHSAYVSEVSFHEILWRDVFIENGGRYKD